MIRVNLNSVDKVKMFASITFNCEADLLLRHGKYCVDAKSTMGILSLNLAENLDLEIIEKNAGETESIFKALDSVGLIVHE